MSSPSNNGLIERQPDALASRLDREREDTAANHAPAREPEVWDERIPDFNPLFAHTPEPEPVQLSPAFLAGHFSVESYLAEERAKDLLRFSTAGSVDDGKSTLIGRLLYDTASVYDDQLRSIEGKGTTAPGVLDLALLTDGLRAEREQGITIDVAYRYFATSRRKFIIADTPGHEQYTRNMATGASTADFAIVLIDARKGLLPQSRRHAAITTLLGVRHLVVAVNKMDLVGYDRGTFDAIEYDFRSFLAQLTSNHIAAAEPVSVHVIPLSALTGENVVHGAHSMPWYAGPTLLQLLESLPAPASAPDAPFRFAVQRVVRPDLDFRGFAGQIASGTVRPGDSILVQPSGRRSHVTRIVTFDGDLPEASAPLSVTLTLADEIDISRGDLLASPAAPATVSTRIAASLVWMSETPLALNTRFLLKHTSRSVGAEVRSVEGIVDLTSAAMLPSATLALNGIGVVTLETRLPLTLDPYLLNRRTGSFVLIDPGTNSTVAAGMIRHAIALNDKPREVFDATASTYDRNRALLIPDFESFYRWAVDLVPPTARRILDLGAGTGLLSAFIRSRLPEATLHLVDLSEAMLTKARERFAGQSGISFQCADYARAPLGGPYDAIVSALSIHHLADPDKESLFAAIYQALSPGGVFVDAEQILGATPALEEQYKSRWLGQVRAAGATEQQIADSLFRQEADRCATVDRQLAWLREAGFDHVDCWFKSGRFAVLAGTKSDIHPEAHSR